MAPEQIKDKCYQYLTDIYGFGSILADLFFGIKIEFGKGIKEFLENKVDSEIEKGIKKILERCLKEQPKDRYPHMLEVEKQLLTLKKAVVKDAEYYYKIGEFNFYFFKI